MAELPEGEEVPAPRPALDLTVSSGNTTISLRIEDRQLAGRASTGIGIGCELAAGIAIAGGVGLAVFFCRNPQLVTNAITRALEGPGLQVGNIAPGSILVQLHCITTKSFESFMHGFETGKVRQRLEEEFTKIGYPDDLEVTIVNDRDVYAKLDLLRSFNRQSKGRKRTEMTRKGTAYNRLQYNKAGPETEFVKVRKDLKGYVIGKDGCSIKQIMKSSGALITSPGRNDEGFFVRGDAEQRKCAKRLILEKAHELQVKKSEIAPTLELVEIPSECKGFVIGRGGENLRQISSQTGANLIRKDGNVYLASGTEEQRQHAKKCIIEMVRRKSEENAPPGEFVDIPSAFKGLIMGKGGDNLSFISTKTGAKLIRKDGEVYIVSGTDEQKEQARLHIKVAIAGARLRGSENEFAKPRVYIDGWNLPEDCEVKLKKLVKEDRMVHPGWDKQFRLIPSDHNEPQVSNSTEDPPYLSQLVGDALESLKKIKEQMTTEEYLKADMWCHFGRAIIRGPDEEEAEEGEWTIEDVRKKFQIDNGEHLWRTSFKEGVDLDENILERISDCESTPQEYVDYAARFDLAFLTPRGNQIRFKVWITRNNTGKKLEDIPIPYSDVKNILEEIHFQDETTRSRCRGWLVLPSRKYLQADILFPGCEFDCRLTIRGRMESALPADYVPDKESTQALSGYLSRLTLTEENGLEICLPERDPPEGFHLIHKRRSERSLYEIYPGFAVIFSKESSWRSDISTEDSRESTDLHLHCREWDELLNSGEWEPEQITAKLPEFFRFVKEVQRFVLQEMRTKTDQ